MSQPIYGTDLTQPMSKLLEGWRNQLTQIRGQMHDAGFEWSGWRERLDPMKGLLTCGIVTLHYETTEAKEYEAKWGVDYLQKASAQDNAKP